MIERKAVLEVYECPSGDIKDVLLQGELPNEQNADNVRLLAVKIIENNTFIYTCNIFYSTC